MKILLVGGAHQGKLDYARSRWGAGGGAGDTASGAFSLPVVDRLHLLVRELMDQGKDPWEEVLSRLGDSWLVICDEVGCGVVPMDPLDRRWREEVGRLCCDLAARADLVQRIACGLPQTLKEGT